MISATLPDMVVLVASERLWVEGHGSKRVDACIGNGMISIVISTLKDYPGNYDVKELEAATDEIIAACLTILPKYIKRD